MLVSGEFSDELLAGSETFRNFVGGLISAVTCLF